MLIVATGGVDDFVFVPPTVATIFERSILITGSAVKLNALALLDIPAGALMGADVAASEVICGKLL